MSRFSNVGLIINKKALRAILMDEGALMQLVKDMGMNVSYHYTEKEADVADYPIENHDLLIVVGGDGTVANVLKKTIDSEVPVMIIPAGTANNIANTLDVRGRPGELIKSINEFKVARFDLGRITLGKKEILFVESAGVGFFADIYEKYRPEKGKSLPRMLKAVGDTIFDYEAEELQIVVDNTKIKDDYYIIEILNVNAVGPRLKFAPDADPSDGYFNVVTVNKDVDKDLSNFVTNIYSEEILSVTGVNSYQGKKVVLPTKGLPLHVDDDLLEADLTEDLDRIVLEIMPGAKKVLVPEEFSDES